MQAFVVTLAGTGHLSADDFVELAPAHYLHVCRAHVESGGIVARFLLGLATHPSTAGTSLDALTPALATEATGTRAVLVTDSNEGSAVATVTESVAQDATLVAAAVAVMQANWGWDESPNIIVRVNGSELHAAPHFNGEHWTAVVSSQGRTTSP
jgi:hypothetical protein